jgi:hypothetical protein
LNSQVVITRGDNFSMPSNSTIEYIFVWKWPKKLPSKFQYQLPNSVSCKQLVINSIMTTELPTISWPSLCLLPKTNKNLSDSSNIQHLWSLCWIFTRKGVARKWSIENLCTRRTKTRYKPHCCLGYIWWAKVNEHPPLHIHFGVNFW